MSGSSGMNLRKNEGDDEPAEVEKGDDEDGDDGGLLALGLGLAKPRSWSTAACWKGGRSRRSSGSTHRSSTDI